MSDPSDYVDAAPLIEERIASALERIAAALEAREPQKPTHGRDIDGRCAYDEANILGVKVNGRHACLRCNQIVGDGAGICPMGRS